MLDAFKTSASVDFGDVKESKEAVSGPIERGAYTGGGLLVELVTPLRPTLEQPVPKGLHPFGDPKLKQFVKNCSQRERLILKTLVDDCLPWERPHAGE